jgi:hypothetical protein
LNENEVTADNKPAESEGPKITVKSFANLSKFSPPKALQALRKDPLMPLANFSTGIRPIIQPKAYEIPKRDVGKEKLLVRPKVIEIPKNIPRVEINAGKSLDLKALMQKQTEENLRKLQSAVKNAQIISNSPQQQKEPQVVQIKPQQPPTKKLKESEAAKPTKFYIHKPVPNNADILDENKLQKDPFTNLRPWLSKPIKKFINKAIKLLATPALISTFKCMGSKCDIYTNNREEFEKHLITHIRTTPGDVANYIVCSYCDFDFKDQNYSIAYLIQHILEEHAFDKYQCKYCKKFYF